MGKKISFKDVVYTTGLLLTKVEIDKFGGSLSSLSNHCHATQAFTFDGLGSSEGRKKNIKKVEDFSTKNVDPPTNMEETCNSKKVSNSGT